MCKSINQITFLSYITHCILANNDEPSPTEYKNEEDLEFGVCHEILSMMIEK